MKEIIFIQDKNHIKKIKPAQLVIGLNSDVYEELKKRKISFKTKEDYLKLAGNVEKKATDWTNTLSNKKIKNRKLKELFTAEGISVWWLMKLWVYYSGGAEANITETIRNIEAVKNIIEKEKASKIYYPANDSLTSNILDLLTKSYKIENVRYNSKRKKNKRNQLRLANLFLLRAILRKLFCMFMPDFRNRKTDILVISHIWQKNSDPYTSPIIKELNKKNIKTISIDKPSDYALDMESFSRVKKKQNDKLTKHKMIESYLNFYDMIKIEKETHKIIKKYKAVKKKRAWKRIFEYDKVNIWKLIEPKFDIYFNFRLLGHIMNILLIKNMLETENPKVVVNPNESGPFSISLFAICKKKKIATIAIQHGAMECLPYMVHNQEEIRYESTNSIDYYPIATKTAVYGHYYKRFSEKMSHYHKKAIEVTGNQRYDSYAKPKTNKKEVLKEFNLSREKKVMMLNTESMSTIEERKRLALIGLGAFHKFKKRNKNYQLVIKQHPEEEESLTYRDIIKRLKIKDVKIFRKVNSFRLMSVCEVIFGSESTLHYEAMMLKKPVIIINVRGIPEKRPFVKNKAALSVRKEEEMYAALNNVLNKKRFRETLIKNANREINNHCYKIDGKASLRIAELTRNILRKFK